MIGIRRWERCLIAIFEITRNFGKKPVKGGRPPRDKKLIDTNRFSFGDFLNRLDNLFILFFFNESVMANMRKE